MIKLRIGSGDLEITFRPRYVWKRKWKYFFFDLPWGWRLGWRWFVLAWYCYRKRMADLTSTILPEA